jgi:S-adenosylmethionine synthetase
VVIGWAGYDDKTCFLPPEHYAAHVFRDALVESCERGSLKGQGPDGKLLVRVREEGERWQLEHILVTIQQQESAGFMDVCGAVAETLMRAYMEMQGQDGRWCGRWKDVEVLVNPNGPLVCAGSDSDNGQTGRKLAVDFYGPRVPIGGGALSGKHMGHIDRVGAYAARDAAVRAVMSGAGECLVRLTYAPNVPAPLDVCYEMRGRGERQDREFFNHGQMVTRYPVAAITARLGQGRHFFDLGLPWNNPGDSIRNTPNYFSRDQQRLIC